jgi:hypothetical protein
MLPQDLAFIWGEEAGDDRKQSRLTTPARTQESEDLTLIYIERDSLQDGVVVKGFPDVHASELAAHSQFRP